MFEKILKTNAIFFIVACVLKCLMDVGYAMARAADNLSTFSMGAIGIAGLVYIILVIAGVSLIDNQKT